YGPAFQAVERARIGDGEALGELAAPEGLATAGYRLHPALLDGCFQLLLGLAGDGADGAAWLPVRIARLRLLRPVGRALSCRVAIERRLAHSLVAALRLFEGDEVVAEIEGFRLQRVELARASAPALYEM